MKYKIVLVAVIIIGLFQDCTESKTASRRKDIKGIFVNFSLIEKVKEQIQKKNQFFLPSYTELINKAEIAKNEGSFSVTDKKRIPPSGDKHDYLSMGPYWWPDTTKPDGLPYIRRDGEVNPETRGENVDSDRLNKLLNNVETLTWAFYFSDKMEYAEKAVQLFETWFVNPETKMNPNLNYAQGIPGRVEGRGIGIIDLSGINKLISAMQILEARDKFNGETKQKLYDWFSQYLNWLITSDYGKDEDGGRYNHGTWYDVETAGVALFLGKTGLATTILENVKTKHITTQIEPDGSQPFELARTRSLSYSTMNLRGFINLANMGQTAGVDLWNFETPDGRSIRKALNFLLPYAQGEKKWEFQQITDLEKALEGLRIIYLMSASKTEDKKYLELIQSMPKPFTKLEILIYPFIETK